LDTIFIGVEYRLCFLLATPLVYEAKEGLDNFSE